MIVTSALVFDLAGALFVFVKLHNGVLVCFYCLGVLCLVYLYSDFDMRIKQSKGHKGGEKRVEKFVGFDGMIFVSTFGKGCYNQIATIVYEIISVFNDYACIWNYVRIFGQIDHNRASVQRLHSLACEALASPQ